MQAFAICHLLFVPLGVFGYGVIPFICIYIHNIIRWHST